MMALHTLSRVFFSTPTKLYFSTAMYRRRRKTGPMTMIQDDDACCVKEGGSSCRGLARGVVIVQEENRMLDNMFENEYTAKIVSDRRKWNVGKVSFIMLILFSLTDVVLNLVDAQMDSLEAPDHYDALSADVIRPAFRYHASGKDKAARKDRMGLGSAAISSVTTALSPILPFTGGLDLRREDYWTNGLFGSVSSIAEQVRGAFASQSGSQMSSDILSTRGGSKVAQRTSRTAGRNMHVNTLSNTEPFIALTSIAKLTLKEVSLAFRYAVENTNVDFNGNKFMSSVSSRVKDVITKLSDASTLSRGKDVQVPTTGIQMVAGDIDALQFCAAMRVFAEWRVLRQVPEGYKGYAVGMSLGHKDIVQNVGKIEKAVHEWIEHHAESAELLSPTLRDLLHYEAVTGVHGDKLPRLKEKSAAMGLLWVRRQLHYQTALFANVIQVPSRFETARDAISAAYNEVYDRYHGWAVQKIFTYSFQAAPDTAEVYKVMNPEKFKEVSIAAQNIQGTAHTNRMPSQGEVLNPIEKFGRHIGREWAKITGSVGQLLGNRRSIQMERVRGGSELDASTSREIESFINKQMELDAHEHIVAYLQVAKPILDDLGVLFKEFDMDDPTKV
jgi:hypothetical protein